MTNQRRIYHFIGDVQGVGFRYTTHNIALRHNINGYVRNLPDGRVELVMEGAESEMEDVVSTLSRKMAGFVHRVESQCIPATGEFHQFYIRH